MAGLQRSEVSFRRQGSSGLIWDDKFLNGLLNHQRDQSEEDDNNNNNNNNNGEQEDEEQLKEVNPNTLDRSRSNGGGRASRTGKVSPAIEPPSPKFSACGFCTAFGKPDKSRRPSKPPRKFRI